MIVNGVTLPDIPADVLASHPNAIITLAKNNTLGTETYAFWASSTEFIYLSQEVFPEAENTLSSLNDFMSAAYDEDGLAWKDESVIPAGTNLLLAVNAGLTTLDIIWSNHDIYEVASVNEETGEFTYGDIYFANSEEPKPTRVSIGRSLVDGYAKEVQRLTGTTDQMNAIQIREKLSTVKAGIKIGDTVLPPIPDGVLAEYPYVVIATNDSVHTLAFSRKEWCRVDNSLSGVGFSMLWSQETAKLYELSNSAWIENTSDEWRYMNLSKAYPEWSNHNMYEATAFDKQTYEVTIGTELYYAKRQNFNGEWLPELPSGYLDENLYVFIIKVSGGDDDLYALVRSDSELLFGSVELWASMGITIDNGYSIGSEGAAITLGNTDGMLTTGGRQVWVSGNLSIIPYPIGQIEDANWRLIYTNHDVYDCTDANAETMEFTKGGLYFPPLPAIDSDRVSIGYDLCDGIVEEVQRLSGESEKMNALHAYWKLTQVPVIVTGPGEIIINGVKLPPFPEVDYPYAFIYVQDLSQYGEIVYYLQFSAEKYFYHYLNSNDGYAYAPSDYSAGTIQYQLYKSKIAEGQIWYGEEPTEAFYKDYGKSGIKWSNYDIRKDDPDTGEIVVKRTV